MSNITVKSAKRKNLEIEKIEIVKKFIREFLPKTGNLKAYSGKELDYVAIMLDRVFIRNFGFNLSRTDIHTIFLDLDYEMKFKEGIHNYEKKRNEPVDFVPDRASVIQNFDGTPSYCYYEIDPLEVRNLMKTTVKLPDNTSEEKMVTDNYLKEKIESFIKTINNTKK